jgi:hypothetical protein
MYRLAKFQMSAIMIKHVITFPTDWLHLHVFYIWLLHKLYLVGFLDISDDVSDNYTSNANKFIWSVHT